MEISFFPEQYTIPFNFFYPLFKFSSIFERSYHRRKGEWECSCYSFKFPLKNFYHHPDEGLGAEVHEFQTTCAIWYLNSVPLTHLHLPYKLLIRVIYFEIVNRDTKERFYLNSSAFLYLYFELSWSRHQKVYMILHFSSSDILKSFWN